MNEVTSETTPGVAEVRAFKRGSAGEGVVSKSEGMRKANGSARTAQSSTFHRTLAAAKKEV